MFGTIIEHAAPQGDVLAASDNVERVKLQGFHLVESRSETVFSGETTSGPQPLLAEDEATVGGFGDGDSRHRFRHATQLPPKKIQANNI